MPEHNECLHEADFKRLESLVEKVFDKMDVFIGEMRSLMISEARRQEKIEQIERDINDFHGRVRMTKEQIQVVDSGLKLEVKSVDDKVQVISDWRQRFEGGVKVMLAIPIFCAILTTCIAIYKMMQ